MREKLTVTRELGTALERLASGSHWTNEAILKYHLNGRWVSAAYLPITSLTTDELVTALLIGYEVEEPKVTIPSEATMLKGMEDVKHAFESYKHADTFSYSDGLADGIKSTLSNLGIKAKGINS